MKKDRQQEKEEMKRDRKEIMKKIDETEKNFIQNIKKGHRG